MPADAPFTSPAAHQVPEVTLVPKHTTGGHESQRQDHVSHLAAMAEVPFNQRRLLGHQVYDSAKSTDTYSREVLYSWRKSS